MEMDIQDRQTIVLRCLAKRLNLNQVINIQENLFPFVIIPDIKVILDLQQVHFMDCCAINSLLTMNRIAQANHTLLVLCNLTEHVRLLTDTLKLSHVLCIEHQPNNNYHSLSSGIPLQLK